MRRQAMKGPPNEGLEDQEMTVSELQAHAAAPQPVVSQQLAILRARGVVAARRERS